MIPGDSLNNQVAEEIRRFLMEEHTKLTESIRSVLVQHRKGPRDRPSDTIDLDGETLHDEIQASLLDSFSRQATRVEEALDRLSRGEYGICQDCGESIGPGRLRAVPFAERCTHCQSRAESPKRRSSTSASPR